MKVRELIEVLQKIENKELEVQILPCEEMFANDTPIFGVVRDVQEKVMYLDEWEYYDIPLYKEIDSIIEDHEEEIIDEFQEPDIDDIPKEKIDKWVSDKFQKMHAVIIEATV